MLYHRSLESSPALRQVLPARGSGIGYCIQQRTTAEIVSSAEVCSRSFAMHDESVPHTNPLRTAPNLLTLLRICLVPVLVAAVLEGDYRFGFVLFVVAGLTDALDGTLARLLHQRSMLGQYLDPVADKLLLSALFLVLMHKELIPVTVTVLVFGRDVGILLVAAILYAAVGRREFKPSILGKANTVAQVSAVSTVLLYQFVRVAWIGTMQTFALRATVILTVVSGLHYAWVVLRHNGNGAASGNGVK
jgi:cardiolipin synthase